MVHRHFPSPDSHRLDYQHYGLRDEEHAVSDITVDGLFLGDMRITNLEEARFSLGKHVRNVTIH